MKNKLYLRNAVRGISMVRIYSGNQFKVVTVIASRCFSIEWDIECEGGCQANIPREKKNKRKIETVKTIQF